MAGLGGLGVISDMQCGGWSTTLLTARGELYIVGVMDGLERLGISYLSPLRHLSVRTEQPPPEWGHFLEPLQAGGVLFDLGPHAIALLLHLAPVIGSDRT